jgi:hypothetical protein
MIVLSISAVFVRMRGGFAFVMEGLGGVFCTSARGTLSVCGISADMVDVFPASMPEKTEVYEGISGLLGSCSSARMSGLFCSHPLPKVLLVAYRLTDNDKKCPLAEAIRVVEQFEGGIRIIFIVYRGE